MKTQKTTPQPKAKAKFLGLLVDKPTYEKVQAAASNDGRSVSNYLRVIIERELEKSK